MSAKTYYNEIDPYAAEWLRNLIRDGHIAPGDVDTRSIEDVRPDDLRPYTQCHFFAGVGLWSLALRRAGWADDRPIWTGSCPCQPFSSAGKGDGFGDERHLWPAFHHLITQCGPALVCGEQVASKDGYAWLDLVQTDMEGMGYAFWPVVLPVAGVGGPHERHRTWWVALGESNGSGGALRRDDRTISSPSGPHERTAPGSWRDGDAAAHPGTNDGRADTQDRDRGSEQPASGTRSGWSRFAGSGAVGGLDDRERARLEGHAGDGGGACGREAAERSASAAGVFDGMAHPNGGCGEGWPTLPRWDERDGPNTGWAENSGYAAPRGAVDDLADSEGGGLGVGRSTPDAGTGGYGHGGGSSFPLDHNRRPGPVNGFWRDADWIFCTDGRWRPVEPGTRPLAHGLPLSMGSVGAGLGGLCDLAGVDKHSLKRAQKYRVGTLRGYGNAISPEPAREFIESWMDVAQ